MAEILVENQICEACGTEARAGSLFCYSCGKSVALKTIDENDNKEASPNEIRFRENIVKDEETTEPIQEELKLEEKSEISEKAHGALIVETPTEQIVEKPLETVIVQEQTKLKSAASLRRKPKFIAKQKVEIVWEERENAPNVWFVLTALFLTAVAAGIVILALRLR